MCGWIDMGSSHVDKRLPSYASRPLFSRVQKRGNMQKKIVWSKLDHIDFMCHVSSITNDAELANWVREFAIALLQNKAGFSAISDSMLADSREYLEAVSERMKKYRKNKKNSENVTESCENVTESDGNVTVTLPSRARTPVNVNVPLTSTIFKEEEKEINKEKIFHPNPNPHPKKHEQKKSKDDVPALFQNFHASYAGTKRGLLVEYEYFAAECKKRKLDQLEIMPLLLPAFRAEDTKRTEARRTGGFAASAKHMKTWIHNCCWEQDFQIDVPAATKPAFQSKAQRMQEMHREVVKRVAGREGIHTHTESEIIDLTALSVQNKGMSKLIGGE